MDLFLERPILVTSPAKNVYCLQTLAKIAVSLLEYSDEYHEEYPFSYISVHSIKADKNQTCQLCSIFFVKGITFEFWLHQLYRQILKAYLTVDHSNTARESGFGIKYGICLKVWLSCIPNISNISNLKCITIKQGCKHHFFHFCMCSNGKQKVNLTRQLTLSFI